MLLLALFWKALAAEVSVRPVRSSAELMGISACLDCNYALLEDIVITASWTPLGCTATPFSGSFDGQGHAIIFGGQFAPVDGNAGLFGVVKDAVIVNVRLVCDKQITGLTTATPIALGLLAGTAARTTIIGCSATLSGTVALAGGTLTAGGLYGAATGSRIHSSYVRMALTVSDVATLYLGGLAGNVTATKVDYCEVEIASILSRATTAFIGGLVGISDGVTAQESVVHGTIESKASSTVEALGGLLALEAASAAADSLTSCVANVSITSLASANSTVGGGVAVSTGSLIALTCTAILSAKAASPATAIVAVVGGFVGCAAGIKLDLMSVYVNATIGVATAASSTYTAVVGGLVSALRTQTSVVNQSSVVVAISVTVPVFLVGGLVGQSRGESLQMENSGALGAITVGSKAKEDSFVGGIIGDAGDILVRQCYFAGSIAANSTGHLVLGAMIGKASNSMLNTSFALANISAKGSSVTAGSVAYATTSYLTLFYAALNVSIETSMATTFGGLVGSMGHGVRLDNSFAMETSKGTTTGSLMSLGGLVGDSTGNAGNESISGCYAWGSVSIHSTTATNPRIGGLVGSLLGAAGVQYSLAYVNMTSSATTAAAGLLLGAIRAPTRATSAQSTLQKIKFCVAYVAPGGSLTGVKIIGQGANPPTANIHCAAYPGTSGCTALATLNTENFLKGFGIPSIFRLNDSIANGSLSLTGMPAPLSGSTPASPRLHMSAAVRPIIWPVRSWFVDTEALGGFPVLDTIDYMRYCGPYIDCHGGGDSPVSAMCYPGWSTPARTNATLADNLHRCSVFRCASDDDCNGHGVCSVDACACRAGYAGADCMHHVCLETDGAVCGGQACVPFSATSLTGLCGCQRTQFLTAWGTCEAACPPIGFGVCMYPGRTACFPGYAAASGCLEYTCAGPPAGAAMAVGAACNGKGTCTAGRCVCNSGSALLAGNCYTPCAAKVATECVTVDCGADNGCAGRGVCTPSLVGAAASCVCNVDATGRPTGTHFSGPYCASCESGYVDHEGACVPNQCLRCDGGTCAYDSAKAAVVCQCPNGGAPNPTTKKCEVGLSHRNLTITLCVVIICGSALIAAAVATGVVISRNRGRTRRP